MSPSDVSFVWSSCFHWSVLPLSGLWMLGIVYSQAKERKKEMQKPNKTKCAWCLQKWWRGTPTEDNTEIATLLLKLSCRGYLQFCKWAAGYIPSWLSYHTAVPQHYGLVRSVPHLPTPPLDFKGKLWLTSCFLFRFLIVFWKISWGSCGWLETAFLTWCLFPSCLWSDFVCSLIKAGFHSASTFYLLIAAKIGPLHLPGYFILLDHWQLLWLEVKESSDWHYVVLMWCITDSLRP